jgi:GPN-loop GTPase
MFEFLKSLGRKTIIVNLDSGNENIPYESTIDIRDLISLDIVMKELNLGPNGFLLTSLTSLRFYFVLHGIPH